MENGRKRGLVTTPGFWRVWLAASLAYASVTAVAALSTGREGWLKSLGAGLVNALPEALAAPWVWRWTAESERSRPIDRVRLVAVGVFFSLWAAAASSLAFNLWGVLDTPGYRWRLEPAVFVWRFAMGALTFSALAAAGTAVRRSREAETALRAVERAEAVRAKAELATVRSQLNPHFLFNVLHSLVGVVGRDPARAEVILEKLGDLVRDALRIHAEALDQHPLDAELALTRRYLEIERLRLGERLRVDWRDPGSTGALLVPPFALQGLVENAVRHAVSARSGGGTIAIAIEQSGGRLAITVDDDGDGRDVGTNGTRLGHELLRERLRLLHGAAARFEAGARTDGGFRARVELPARADEAAEGA